VYLDGRRVMRRVQTMGGDRFALQWHAVQSWDLGVVWSEI
jgi:hypothetical protein